MSNDSSASIVSKVWNYVHVLKNAGVGYGDCVEQITYLLFLKLADEMTELGFDNPIPVEYRWPKLAAGSADDLEIHYRHTLEDLGKELGLVGIIFRKAQNKISDPSDLQRVIKMIADEDWSGMDVDIKGAIYEGCEPHGHFLEETVSSSDKGAGQCFTLKTDPPRHQRPRRHRQPPAPGRVSRRDRRLSGIHAGRVSDSRRIPVPNSWTLNDGRRVIDPPVHGSRALTVAKRPWAT